MRSSSSVASLSTCCLPAWSASATSASSPTGSAEKNCTSAAPCSPPARYLFPTIPNPALPPSKTLIAVPFVSLDGWLSSNSSASNRWLFKTLHDRRNVPRPLLSRFRSEPRRSSVYGRSDSCRKLVRNPPGTSVFYSGSPSLTFHRAVSCAPFRAISRKNPFNTQRLIPAPFNEFYPKRSGPTIPSLHAIFCAGALPIESVSLSVPADANSYIFALSIPRTLKRAPEMDQRRLTRELLPAMYASGRDMVFALRVSIEIARQY